MLKGWQWALLIVLTAAAVGGIIYTRAAPKELVLHGSAIDAKPDVRDVELMGVDGETLRLGDRAGELQLLFFGYANCPDVCPLTMAKLAGVYEDLGAPDDLQVLMVTVDPERDTPELLDRYVKRFHNEFVGLTGAPSQIATASARFFVASIGSDQNPDGSVSHSSHVTLVDRQGRMRLIYNQDKLGKPLKEDLEKLLAQRDGW
jgi:protein SCO1/2